MMYIENPCLRCGACCAYFRVSFYWGETDPTQGGTVPEESTEMFTGLRVCMKGTNQSHPRCMALKGEIGRRVYCSIYACRPGPCRQFGVHWVRGHVYYRADDLERCNKARKAWSLPPLKPYLSRAHNPGLRSHPFPNHTYTGRTFLRRKVKTRIRGDTSPAGASLM